tara:strand:+ start:1673 stop:3952 length:2280 start_codon:yes stop_codon:yes gene_type:complete
MINSLVNSNKDTLAKLMATENITVIHKRIPTAYFDIKSRSLVCPILKDDMSSELYDLFMGHEVGHALFTPLEGWHDQVSDKGSIFKGYLNVIEDIRIEKKIKAKYPGLRKSFYTAYKELLDDDFFGLKDLNKPISQLNLIDRINLHYKVGHGIRVPFSNDEKIVLDKCEKLETFEDVLKLANELFSQRQEEAESFVEGLSPEQLQELADEMGIEQPEDGGTESNDLDNMVETESKEKGTGDSDGGEESKEEEKGQDSYSIAKQKESDNQDSEETKDTKKGQSDISNQGNEGTPSRGQNTLQDQVKEQLQKSNTDESFRENEEKCFDTDKYGREPVNLEIPERVQYENFIVSFKEIEKEMGEFDRQYVSKFTNNFVNKNKSVVNYMAKEFEMKKAASAYNKSQQSKTGELNMDKLHLYKIKDDIFNRVEITPDGKNHGIVMTIDWSGSMCQDIEATLEQAFLLSMYCRKINIPFQLYAFSDGFYKRATYDNPTPASYKTYGREAVEGEAVVSSLALLEIVSDKMKNTEYQRAMENWFQIVKTMTYRYNYYHQSVDYDHEYDLPGKFYLSGTPLDATLFVIRDLLNDFQYSNNLDIVSFVCLTDGSSHSNFPQGTVLVDRRNNQTFKINTGHGYRATKGLLKWIKATTNARTIGYFLTDAKGRRIENEWSNFTGVHEYDYQEEEKRRGSFNKDGCILTENCNYDLGIVINSRKLKLNYNEDVLQVGQDATKGQLKRALVKTGQQKVKQRIILNKFVQQMAV